MLSPIQIAAGMEVSQYTIYKELTRSQATDDTGHVGLDDNFRPAYRYRRQTFKISRSR